MFVVDRRKFPNRLKAVLYELPLKKNNKIMGPMVLLVFSLGIAVLASFHPNPFSRVSGIMVGLIAFSFPFIRSFILYYSVLTVSDGGYEISFKGFKILEGDMSEIVEIRRLINWNGCYRVKTKGTSDISGFIIFSDNIPSVLKDIKIAEGIYNNMGNDRKVNASDSE